jgi:hypothetical protein
MPVLGQIPGRGYTDNACAKNDDLHLQFQIVRELMLRRSISFVSEISWEFCRNCTRNIEESRTKFENDRTNTRISPHSCKDESAPMPLPGTAPPPDYARIRCACKRQLRPALPEFRPLRKNPAGKHFS